MWWLLGEGLVLWGEGGSVKGWWMVVIVVGCEGGGGWVDGGGTGGQFMGFNVRLAACNYSEDCQNVKMLFSRWEHEMEARVCGVFGMVKERMQVSR